MGKTTIKYAVAISLILSVMAMGQDRENRREQEKQNLSNRIEQTKLHIQELKVEALEHEAQIKRLEVEIAGLELRIQREIAEFQSRVEGDKPGPRRPEDRPKTQGNELEQMDGEIGALRERSRQAEKEGRMEEASYLERQAEALTEELKFRIWERESVERLDRNRARMEELRGRIREAERQGREREIAELRQEAEVQEREMHAMEQGLESGRMEREIRNLHQLAAQTREQGQGDKAEAIQREAEQLQKRLAERSKNGDRPNPQRQNMEGPRREDAERPQRRADERPEDRERPTARGDRPNPQQQEMDGLRRENAELREMVGRLKREMSR